MITVPVDWIVILVLSVAVLLSFKKCFYMHTDTPPMDVAASKCISLRCMFDGVYIELMG